MTATDKIINERFQNRSDVNHFDWLIFLRWKCEILWDYQNMRKLRKYGNIPQKWISAIVYSSMGTQTNWFVFTTTLRKSYYLRTTWNAPFNNNSAVSKYEKLIKNQCFLIFFDRRLNKIITLRLNAIQHFHTNIFMQKTCNSNLS